MSHYNIIVGYFDGCGTSTVSGSRFYLPQDIIPEYQGQTPNRGTLKSFCTNIPTLFSDEITRDNVPIARVGWITNIVQNGRDYQVTYRLPSGIVGLSADQMAEALGLSSLSSRGIGEMQHSHWTIKEGDLLNTLCQAELLESTRPSIFTTPNNSVQNNLVSVMMPFSPTFTPVYGAINEACESLNLECRRADNIWEHSTVIQDIYSLIYRSKIVVCDFSVKNPNVFYEAGIAHSLGREVIPIVQHPDDIPFDLQHHRYIRYLNNAEGLRNLVTEITPRLQTLMNRRT